MMATPVTDTSYEQQIASIVRQHSLEDRRLVLELATRLARPHL